MGCGSSSDPRSEEVSKELEDAKLQAMQIHKLLLLGSGNSGKSTFMKQLTSIHGDDRTTDATSRVQDIQQAVFHQMHNLLQVYQERYEVEEMPDGVHECIKTIMLHYVEGKLSDEVVSAIEQLWADSTVKQVFQTRQTLSVVESAAFFFDDIRRISAHGYQPTEEDYLLVRIKTTGIFHKRFIVEGKNFEVVDVGGQRSERNKWINCFDTVDAVLYVASLSCYDQMLHEEETTHAMLESLTLFQETLNNRYFRKTTFILFLNKRDLFKIKIEDNEMKDPDDPSLLPPNLLRRWFEDYTGKDYDYDDGVQFILQKYKSMSRYTEEEKPIFHHVTCATDTDNVRKVFDAVQNSVVMRALQRNNLL